MIIGLDYASVDGNKKPDLAAAYKAGARFAFVRGAYGAWSDPTVKRDADDVRESGMVFGAYLFALPGPKHPAPEKQVAAMPALLPGDFPPALDVEFPAGVAATGMSRAEVLAWVRAAAEAMRRRYGCAPLIYTSKRVWDGHDTDSLGLGSVAALELTDCPLWLARYPFATRIPPVVNARAVDRLPWAPVPAAWGDGNLWVHQYQGDAIRFPGFSATTDLNRFKIMGAGETGRRVRWAQRRLRMLEGDPGVFDHAMLAQVLEFQEREGLVTDGVIGPQTFARLAWR